jgi:hypothetical protein
MVSDNSKLIIYFTTRSSKLEYSYRILNIGKNVKQNYKPRKSGNIKIPITDFCFVPSPRTSPYK